MPLMTGEATKYVVDEQKYWLQEEPNMNSRPDCTTMQGDLLKGIDLETSYGQHCL